MGSKKYGPKSLHHGTILLNVNLDNMNNYLNPNKLKLISKGIDSVKARVTNLCDIYPQLELNRDKVFSSFEKEFLKYYSISDYDRVLVTDENDSNFQNENNKIFELYKKYSSWEWLYGECPEFSNSLFHKFDFGLIDLSLNVQKGIFQNINVF